MVAASDADNFSNTTQQRIYFCTGFHYSLLKPVAKVNTLLLPPHQENEVRRQEEQVDADLTARGYQFHGLKLPAKLQLLRQDITEKEETTNGEYDVDITRYFKLLSSDVDETIFEDE